MRRMVAWRSDLGCAIQRRRARLGSRSDKAAAKLLQPRAALRSGFASPAQRMPPTCPTPLSNALAVSVCFSSRVLRVFACSAAHRPPPRTEASGSLYTTIRRFQGLRSCGHPSHKAHTAGTEPIQATSSCCPGRAAGPPWARSGRTPRTRPSSPKRSNPC